MTDTEGQDLTPVRAVQAAVASLHAALEAAGPIMELDRDGWSYVADAYRVLQELAQLSALVGPAVCRVRQAVEHEQELNLIRIDPHTEHAGRPDVAVRVMGEHLDVATTAAEHLHRGLAGAAEALTWAGYGGRQEDLDTLNDEPGDDSGGREAGAGGGVG